MLWHPEWTINAHCVVQDANLFQWISNITLSPHIKVHVPIAEDALGTQIKVHTLVDYDTTKIPKCSLTLRHVSNASKGYYHIQHVHYYD